MNIGIVGLGLIGGSLGLDLRARGHRVLGVSRKLATCDRAISRGAVDIASEGLELMAQADLVFLCTPLGVMPATVEQLLPHLAASTVLTDVGSVKGWVMAEIAPRWPNFVGGHPMAGKAESGIESAQANLFRDRPYVLTPTPETPGTALETVEGLVRSLEACLFHCQPDEHDRAVAWISHLPVMISASLIGSCLAEPDPEVAKLAKAIASSGFQDTSRVGGGNPELGMMIAQYNTEALLRSLTGYRQMLDQIVAQVESHNWAALEALLQQTHTARPDFLN